MRRKHRRGRGFGQADPRAGQGAEVKRTQSKYGGNNEQCPACDVTYGSFKTGLTYFEVWMMFWDPPESPREQWTYATRGVVLGKWFQIKQEFWEQHKETCGQGTPVDLDVDLIPFGEADMSDCPF